MFIDRILMEQPLSSLSFTSSYPSNGSSSNTPSPPSTDLEIVSLSKLSTNLESLLIHSSDFDCTDADVVVEGAIVGVHRCILAARSGFFRELFCKKCNGEGKKERPRYWMKELLPKGGRITSEAFKVFLGYMYTGRLRQAPLDVSTCVDRSCAHDACRPAVNFAVELMYASSVFQIPDLASLFQRRLLNFVEKALVEDVIPILLVAFHSQINQLLSRCIQRIARSNLDNISLEKELPHEVAEEIKSMRAKSEVDGDLTFPDMDPVHDKRIRRLHRSLDSDDVELVKLLLSESNVTLDDATALHYAAAYCDSKVVAEVLDLGMANVNLKNNRGYAPLHVAAMRREPAVIMSLLNKGAYAAELTSDGQSAVSICKRLTRAKDYNTRTMQGQESNKDRLCIDILEREMMRNPLAEDDSMTSTVLADNVHAKLIYLENRVAFARIFFPAEAKLAMKIAQAETTSEFAGLAASRSSGNLMEVDLNETPTVQNKRLRSRVDALVKTVELGRRYFPHCSEVLDKFLEDDHPDILFLQKGTPDEQKIKRRRLGELKDDVLKAFSKDKAERGFSSLSSSSSSSSSQKGNPKQHRSSSK